MPSRCRVAFHFIEFVPLGIFFVALGGCVVHPADRSPQPEVAIPVYSRGREDGETVKTPVSVEWWRSMQSARLNECVELALRTSHTVEAARARLDQADALYRRAASVRWPWIDLKGKFEHDIEAETRREDYGEIGPALSWEMDLFGRLESTRRTRQAERESRLHLLEGVQLTLTAGVTEAYLGVIEQKELLRLLHSQQLAAIDFLKIIQQRYDQGLISKVDLLQQQSQLADIQSLIPDAEANLLVQQNILQTLIGGLPTEGESSKVDDTLPVAADLPGIGNPGDLLERRPDLLVARSDLMAADADIGRAIAERLPRLTFSADALLVDGRGREGMLSTMTVNLLGPLLDWGNRRAEVSRSKAVYRERLAAFTQAYVDAVLEVENVVAREGKQRELIQRLEERRALLENALEQTQGRYTTGLTDYLPVLTSLQQLNAVEQRLIRERRRLLSLRVTLHRALGGPLRPVEPSAAGSDVRNGS